MSNRLERFRAACRESRPETFLVLGSGLGAVVDRVECVERLGFADVPGLPASSVAGHRGEFVLGRFGGRFVLVGAGRLHFYEGHPWSVVTRPIEFAAELGVRDAILTNAAGGIRPDLEPGRIMPIRVHMECSPRPPWWVHPEPSPYDAGLLAEILAAGPGMTTGVYAALSGPSYETPAEIRALRGAGADAVGMSTSREALAGRAAGLRCAAISFITNRAAGLGEEGALSHADVLEAAKNAGESVGDLLEEVVRLTR